MSARKLAVCLGLSFLLFTALAPAAAQGAFGIASLSTTARNKGGSVDLQAGTHPYEYEVAFTMNQDSEGKPEGTLRDLIVELPPGLVGNPLAVPRCTGAEFEGALPRCAGNTQIGVAHLQVIENGIVNEVVSPVFNLTPPLGALASIGFSAINLNSFQEASLRSGSDYGVDISDITIPTDLEFQAISETIWGVPADPAHDAERTCYDPETESFIHGCSTDVAEAPFLSLPTSCAGPLKTTLKADSLQEPNVFVEESTELLGEGGTPESLHSCETPPFEPQITTQPETTAADSPTGLHVGLRIPQNEDPRGSATAHLKDTVITLPQGLVVNASAADGRGACSPAQIGLQTPAGATPIEFTPDPAECPPNSKLGTVEVETPAVDHPLPGAVYLAKQGDNPFNSLIALYVTVHDPVTGVVAKLPGKVEPDPITGQLKASFRENPQLPFEDFKVDFFGGPRAALTTPSTCGAYTTTSDLTPWTSPEGPDAFPSDSFDVTAGAGGGGCASSEAQMPNAPTFEAGTAAPLAGSFSPLAVKLSRENGSQRFAAVNLTLPPGVSAKLAGVTPCSDAQLAAAAARREPGEGVLEKQSPSCPASSQVGVVNVGAGSGAPLFVQGKAYLAGPYKGAPVSLAIVTPAVAGPFDLGTVVVRSGLYLNPETAQVTARSEDIPQILQGIPLDLRTIAVQIDRNDFTLNPTSCEEMAIDGELTSTAGQVAPLRNRFQVGGCRGLDYEPRLSLRLHGATKRGGHPALRAVFSARQGEANTARLAVALPHSEFLDQGHIRTVCTRVQFAANECPAGSIYGRVRARSPLLDYALQGPVYLRSSSHQLPDLVAALRGPASQPIEIDLAGRIDSVNGGIRSTFEATPDAPVSRVVLSMQGGKKGLLENSTNLCAGAHRATLKAVAHNGKGFQSRPLLKAGKCGKGRR